MSSRHSLLAPQLQRGFVAVAPLSGPQYLKKSGQVSGLISTYYQFIKDCRRTLPQFPNLAGCADDVLMGAIDKLAHIFPSILPDLTSMTEGLQRRHKEAYAEMISAITDGINLHTVCVLARVYKGKQLHRYDDCIIPLQRVMSYPPSRNGRAQLHPDHIHEFSRLESEIGAAFSTVLRRVFEHMRTEGQNDQVDYLIETTLRLSAEDNLTTPAAKHGAKEAFKDIYRVMSDVEKGQVQKNCHYTRDARSQQTIDSWMREVTLEDAAKARHQRDAALVPQRAFAAK